MVSHCMKSGSGFVVTLLKEGTEIHRASQPIAFGNTGCMAVISDFGQKENGLLTIEAKGGDRVLLKDIHQQEDGLWVAQPETLPERGSINQEEDESLQVLLTRLLDHQLMAGLKKHVQMHDPVQVMNYLIMLLPMGPQIKQALLETDNLELRYQNLAVAIHRLEEKANA